MGLLTTLTAILSECFAVTQDLRGCVEYLLNGVESVAAEISIHVALGRFWTVVTLKVKNPEGIEMWMHRHM